jgi:hypothetical protein
MSAKAAKHLERPRANIQYRRRSSAPASFLVLVCPSMPAPLGVDALSTGPQMPGFPPWMPVDRTDDATTVVPARERTHWRARNVAGAPSAEALPGL